MAKVKEIVAVDGVTVRRAPRMSVEEYRAKLGLKRLTEFGEEMPSDVPMAPPVGYKKQPSIFENMRALVKAELARKAADEGFDTEDDNNNFDVPEERDPFSKHEFTEMDEEFVSKTAVDHNNKVAAAKQKAAQAAMEASERAQKEASQGEAKPPREALDGPPEPAKGDKK